MDMAVAAGPISPLLEPLRTGRSWQRPPQRAKSTVAFCFEMRGAVALTTRVRERNTRTLSLLRYINYLPCPLNFVLGE